MEDKLFIQTLRYLQYRPRSEKEIRDYLAKKIQKLPSVDPSLVDIIIHKLKQQKFLNDKEFAAWLIRSRTSYRPRGEYLIRLELKQKGIAEDIIVQALGDSENRQQSDVELAKEILEKRAAKYEGMERQERFSKAGSFLARRGFDIDTIREAIDKVFEK